MEFEGMRVVITGGGRGLGRRLAEEFARRGAHVFVSARDEAAAKETVRAIEWEAVGTASAHVCDLAEPASVVELAEAVGDRIDVLINNGAAYLEGPDVSEGAVENLISGAVTGTVLLTERLLPLLRRSDRADVVNIVSSAAEPGNHRSTAHPAFYAAKHAQAGYAEILSHRLRPEGIRVISLFPPDFVQDGPRTAGSPLTAASVADCVLFAVRQPRDCFLREFRFEQL